jgi:hypothetical protein
MVFEGLQHVLRFKAWMDHLMATSQKMRQRIEP